jgi:hypothetical protein
MIGARLSELNMLHLGTSQLLRAGGRAVPQRPLQAPSAVMSSRNWTLYLRYLQAAATASKCLKACNTTCVLLGLPPPLLLCADLGSYGTSRRGG